MEKIERAKLYELFENGLTTEEIVSTTGVSRRTVMRAKNEWKNSRSFTQAEKMQANEITTNSKISEAGGRISMLEPIVLNAIYRMEKYQTLFFCGKYNAYFDGDNKITKTIFDFFKWAVKKVGYMPSQTRIAEMWDNCLKNSKTPLTDDEKEELSDMFDKIIWDIDEDTDWLSEKVEEYIALTESTVFCDKVVKLIKGDGSVAELKEMITKMAKNVDIPDEEFFSLDEKLNGNVSKFFPFFIPQINDKIKGLPCGVNVLCGASGTGKTMACINQEVALARKGIASIHFILGDLFPNEYQCRVLAHLSQRDYWDIVKDVNLQQRIIEDNKEILKYITITSSTEAKTMDSYLRDADKVRKRQAAEHKPVADFICFDYDDLISCNTSDEWKRATEIYAAAQTYGMANGVCVLMVSQPTKAADDSIRKGERTMRLSDLSGGRMKGNTVAVALGFSTGVKEQGAKVIPVTVEILKGRNGGGGEKAEVFFEGDKCSYILGLVSNDKMEPEDDFNGFENELPF